MIDGVVDECILFCGYFSQVTESHEFFLAKFLHF
tara:strand:- start:327 stop:428 length:102 start_codon:yes stop_codon:yes gene_type:complete